MNPPQILHGNNLDLLRQIPDCSVDSIVTDPPYELGFMGKKWDSTGIAYSVELWSECLRVLKHGGHLLAFSGSRTYHRMVVAIEDAGFEIRDQIMWVYGSGFPKSLDVSKAIDKRGGVTADFQQFREAVINAMQQNKVSRTELQNALGNFMLSHYLTKGSQPAIPNVRDYEIIKKTVQLGNDWDFLFLDSAQREVIGQKNAGLDKGSGVSVDFQGAKGRNADGLIDVTAPATDAAQQWSGWGTALKPAHEPIVMARKPLIGTVAENVLRYGTGAINIDASRVGTDGETTRSEQAPYTESGWRSGHAIVDLNAGRFPANFIHDGSDEVLALFPDSKSTKSNRGNAQGGLYGGGWSGASIRGHDDSGSAARFFYCAKAGKAERNAGLEALPTVRASAMGYERGLGDAGEEMFKDRNPQKQNFHPTVKPVALMRYLVRMVTPPEGTVLDPFTGSGTTLVAAVLEGFNSIGMEMTADYLPIIEGRVAWALAQEPEQPTLF